MGSKASLIFAILTFALFTFWVVAFIAGEGFHWAGVLFSGVLAAMGFVSFFTARADERRGRRARRAIR